MFCLKCGKEIDDSAMRCPYCDCPIENAGEAVDVSTMDPTIKSANSLGIVGIILGALGIFWGLIIALLGWILGGVGLALSLVGRNKNKFVKSCKAGAIVSAIALGLSFVNSILGIILYTM